MFKNAINLFEIFGFRIKLDPSWFLIAALIIWTLSQNYFPYVLPNQTPYDYLAIATAALLGLFGSLILHELAHSVVARWFGLAIGGITLFIFGGVAELEQEPASPKSEFWIAIAGPLMSLLLALISYVLLNLLHMANVSSALEVLFEYLATVNLVLVAFNIVPAFPLDGGRIFRSILWYWKNDLVWATNIAASAGKVFAILLITSGLILLFMIQSVGGIWQILIGVFLYSAAQSTQQQTAIKQALLGQTVANLMSTDILNVDPEMSLDSVAMNIMLRNTVSFLPVVEDGHLLGYISTDLIREIDEENWPETRVSDIFVETTPENSVLPETPIFDVFELMAKRGQRKLLVTKNKKLLGVICLSDLMSYLAIKQGLGLANHTEANGREIKHA